MNYGIALLIPVTSLCLHASSLAQDVGGIPKPMSAAAAMRPLGAPSALNFYVPRQRPQLAVDPRQSSPTNRIEQTAYQWTEAAEANRELSAAVEPSVLQVQGFTMPQVNPINPGNQPSTAPVMPPMDAVPQNPPSLAPQQVLPPAQVPQNAFPNNNVQPRPATTNPPLQSVPQNVYPNDNYAMNQNWDDCIATIDNSPYVTAPVRYISSQPCGCGPYMQTGYTTVPQTFTPPPAVIGQPVLTPDVVPPGYYPNDVGFKPLLSLGQERYNVVLGRGIIGQPTAYVPGQTFRNILRYLSP